MSARLIIVLAASAGLLLAIAGVSVLFWMAPIGAPDVVAAAALAAGSGANVLYAMAVLVSSVLLAPVLLVLTMRLYSVRPAGALVGVALFGFGLVLECVGTMGSLARIPVTARAAAGDPGALGLFQALTVQYLATDFAGVALLYVGGIVYAGTLWRVHRATSWMLIASTVLLFLGFAVATLALPFLAASIVVYGAAYALLGIVAVRLELVPV